MIMNNLLHKIAIENNYQATHFTTIDSTNDAAFKIAKNKNWIIADKQERGRGRRGRIWQSPIGNLYTSLLIYAEFNHNIIFSYIAGLSLINTVQYFADIYNISNFHLSLKWPNDIIIDNKKLSGILLEVKPLNEEFKVCIIGMGVNIATNVETPQYQTICLHDIGIKCTSLEFFKMLSYYWTNNYNLWQTKGNEIIRKKWLSHNSYLGKVIKIKTDSQMFEGTFIKIDENFNCVLGLATNELITINTGDILLNAT